MSVLIIQTLFACNTKKSQVKPNSIKENQTTIIGVANNAKMGGIILTEDNDLFYIDGVDSWDDGVVGKKVKVTGTLKEETFKEEDLKNEKGEWIQGMVGTKSTIMNPVWEMIKE